MGKRKLDRDQERAPFVAAAKKADTEGAGPKTAVRPRRGLSLLRGLRQPERVVILIACCIGIGAIYFAFKHVSGEQGVEVDLSDAAGRTSIALATQTEEISPGCGCLDPSAFAQHPWVGMSMPSNGFDLDVTNEQGGEVANGLWALTVMEPEVGETNWFAPPTHSIWMRVIARRAGKSRVLFVGRTTHVLLWANGPVHVRQSAHNPYAALIPAGGGETTFTSSEAARSAWPGSVNAATTVPDRPEEVRSYNSIPSVAERGPMIDVLGPTDHFVIRASMRTRLWAALQEVSGARPGDQLDISIRTPFSLRLFPSPVQSRWQRQLPEAWSRQLLSTASLSAEDGRVSGRATAQGRFLLTEPLPAYSVTLAHIISPQHHAWRSFAKRSRRNFQLSPMLGDAAMDRELLTIMDFALPPVPQRQAISVFGKITDFKSSSVRGSVSVGGTSHPVIRGSALHFQSSEGLAAGRYALTPLISTGQPTKMVDLSGSASVWQGGAVVTHPWWSTKLPFGALIAAIVSIVCAGAFAWVRGGSSPE